MPNQDLTAVLVQMFITNADTTYTPQAAHTLDFGGRTAIEQEMKIEANGSSVLLYTIKMSDGSQAAMIAILHKPNAAATAIYRQIAASFDRGAKTAAEPAPVQQDCPPKLSKGLNSQVPGETTFEGVLLLTPDGQQVRGFTTASVVTTDMRNQVGRDIITSLFSTRISSKYTLAVLFESINEQPYEIEAPARSTRLDDDKQVLIRNMGTFGIVPMISGYFLVSQ